MAALDTIEILERLVACPTVSRDSNLTLIDWVRNYLADCGVGSHLVPDATGRKANLFASIGPAKEGGLVFSGHTDVVPVDGQAWESDPFKLTAKGSHLYARGACDMKGFIAAVLARIPNWIASNLSHPVHLMLSYDEEVGCLGAPSMISAATAILPKPAAVIVGEPTGMRLANAHKGISLMRTQIRGIEAHSSLTHQGVSAVMLAADLVARLGDIARERAAKVSGESPAKRFDPPYTTLSVNRIKGGTAINILASSCEFEWDIRALPGEKSEAILEQLSSFASARVTELIGRGQSCTVETTVLAQVPPFCPDAGPAEKLVQEISPCAKEPITVPFACEGGQFQRAGWSTVICGPGSIEQAHKPNEFIERSELSACAAFLDRAVSGHCRM